MGPNSEVTSTCDDPTLPLRPVRPPLKRGSPLSSPSSAATLSPPFRRGTPSPPSSAETLSPDLPLVLRPPPPKPSSAASPFPKPFSPAEVFIVFPTGQLGGLTTQSWARYAHRAPTLHPWLARVPRHARLYVLRALIGGSLCPVFHHQR